MTTRYRKLQQRTHEILDKGNADDRPSRIFDIFIVTLIAINVVAVILETVSSYRQAYGQYFAVFELFSVIIFSIEYTLRLWSITIEKKYAHPLWGRLRFIFTPMAIIDLVAVLPFYMPASTIDLRFVRSLRLLRLFKVIRYSEPLLRLGKVFHRQRQILSITITVEIILLVIVSAVMYYAENAAQPEAFSSIPAAMWWGVATLTTVGYGDIYPITALGKFLGTLIAFIGIGLFALPAGIIASGFMEELESEKKCPHCGKDL
jgi:voltage-gated potassium channel